MGIENIPSYGELECPLQYVHPGLILHCTPLQEIILALLGTWLGSQNSTAKCGSMNQILGTCYLHFTRFHCPFD